MAKFTRDAMIANERLRLCGRSTLQLMMDYCDMSRSELIEELMEHYEEDVNAGNIVPCADCGQDCSPDEESEDPEAEWYCEKCGDEGEGQ